MKDNGVREDGPRSGCKHGGGPYSRALRIAVAWRARSVWFEWWRNAVGTRASDLFVRASQVVSCCSWVSNLVSAMPQILGVWRGFHQRNRRSRRHA